MKGAVLFAAGLMVGFAAHVGLAQSQNVVMMNHVGINVPNITEAIAHYTQKMGYREAFRVTDAAGQPTLVYLHVSRDTFLELQQSNADRPAGFTHYGLVVDNMANAVEAFKQRGITVSAVNKSANTNALLANITDPYMGRIELAELTPESRQRRAIDTWK
jgi:catechol 2,3-dioxygenase-like lactoylglutathione lyase family enzyme